MASFPVSRVEKTPGGLAFFGDIDHQSVPGLMEDMPESSTSVTELDVSEAEKIDSAGLAFLIDWGNRNLQAGQKIVLRGANEQLQQMIDIMRLGDLFELQP